MNWKKWVGFLGAGLGISFIPLMLLLFGTSGSVLNPVTVNADTYQLAIASVTATNVVVASSQPTQVDLPQLIGRTSIEIYNNDTSSPIFCGFQPSIPSSTSLALCSVSLSSCAVTYNLRQIPPAPTTAIAGSNWWSLSLSNFSSNRGAYPVSASMGVWCVSGRLQPNLSTATITQSF